MEPMDNKDFIVGPDDPILVTGASGFIGPRVVEALLHRGFRNLRCFVRPSSRPSRIEALNGYGRDGARIDVVEGDLLCPEDCTRASKDVMVVFHLAAGTGEASFPDAFMNSVVTTRNLLDACLQHRCLSRFRVVTTEFMKASGKDASPTSGHPAGGSWTSRARL